MATKVIIVAGLPGSGKSYFAERLARRIGAVYLSSDRIRKKLLSKRTYSDGEKLAVYDAMREQMEEALSMHQDVVADATFFTREIRERFVRGLPPPLQQYMIEVVAAESLTRARLQRPRADSEADYSIYQAIRLRWEPIDRPHLVLHSTDANIDDLLQTACLYLSQNESAPYDAGTDQ